MLTGRNAAPLVHRPDSAGAPAPEQIHLQFGADAASQVAVSWAAPAAVARPRLRVGPAGGAASPAAGSQVQADERVYTDALTGETVFTYHASIGSLEPGTQYAYEVLHDGSPPAAGTFRTGPRGRSGPFRFTSFGDQSVPGPVGLGYGPNSVNARYVVDAVDRLDPLFHLLNGDLCYANASDQPVATWTSYFGNIARSARYRPWMPTPGNHENEAGNGPQGYLSYLTRFDLPGNGTPAFRGNWYAFTAGPVRVLALNNDDVCLQDGGFSGLRRDNAPGYRALGFDPYLHGYSGGLQRQWLERELAAARQDEDIDWIVVFMHQVAMSSAHFNGADLGIRQQWLPLFDTYGVDLVLSGHEHHFERSYPVRGVLPGSSLLTPEPVRRAAGRRRGAAEIDTRYGTVHLTIGGGGHPYQPPARRRHDPHEGIVIAGVGTGSPQVQRRSVIETEPAIWSAYRDQKTPFGFASFDVAPVEPGGMTSITVTYWGAAAGSPAYRPRDRVVLRKPLRAGWQQAGELAGTRPSRLR
ncbi:MAG TPA: metallophosphoesterase family protein [Streptosporangiaceae bacterium]|nr:metallophosphoesterase family protein [Streptosporangiaceae bacterium]